VDGAFDLAIVGGGIHGACLARDATGRGLSVLLVERGDLGGETSSASSKLIHGGLRYLEHLELRLVREALAEREILLATAPHLVRPLRFVLPLPSDARPAWMVRFGLALYDRMGGRGALPGSHAVRLPGTPWGAPLRPAFERGFLYWDARADDARLVLANALDAAARGADVRPRTELLSARRDAGLWRLRLAPRPVGGRMPLGVARTAGEATARALVNAAGPWTAEVQSERLACRSARRLRLVRGSHVVVPRLHAGDHAYILQQPDRRVVFVLPFGDDASVLGTTEVVVDRPGPARIDAAETAYLCAAAARYLRDAPTPRDVLASWSGVRPLLDDGRASTSAVSRDYALDLDAAGAPLLSVWGGKLTTCRRLAERALDLLAPQVGAARGAWTAHAPLPGGDLPAGRDANARAAAAADALRRQFADVSPGLAAALVARHGTRARELLSIGGAGRELAPGLHAAELDWCVRREWALTAEDVLWRRSKAGLRATEAQEQGVDAHLAALLAAPG